MTDIIGKRMKEFYEQIPDVKLMRRTPVAIRVDGKAFHTFTRGFRKPFDRLLMNCMQQTMKYLCMNIQGCVLGYTQSDEITLILVDYEKLDSCAWFDYRVQKMASVAASMATMSFNRQFSYAAKQYIREHKYIIGLPDDKEKYVKALEKALEKGAMFDARCFNIPKEEVCNLIYWRQADATRNSIQMAGYAYFSQKEMQNKNTSQVQDMLHEQKGINWNDYPTDCKRGACCKRDTNGNWIIDKNIPIFKGQDRDYIEKLIYVGEE
jgi:tRNA(His) 5'-end guanylyltransferase